MTNAGPRGVCDELYIWWSHLWQADDRITNRIFLRTRHGSDWQDGGWAGAQPCSAPRGQGALLPHLRACRAACEKTIQELGCQYLDLYLMVSAAAKGSRCAKGMEGSW